MSSTVDTFVKMSHHFIEISDFFFSDFLAAADRWVTQGCQSQEFGLAWFYRPSELFVWNFYLRDY